MLRDARMRSTKPCWSEERDVNRSAVNSLSASEVPGVPANGKGVPAPRDSLPFHFLPPFLPLRLSRFVFHPNLESKLIVTHVYLSKPLTTAFQIVMPG